MMIDDVPDFEKLNKDEFVPYRVYSPNEKNNEFLIRLLPKDSGS